MSTILDITEQDIKDLGAEQLRELVGRLCEAEYQMHKLSLSAVDYGGHHLAGDGGFDVLVDSDVEPPKHCFISNPHTAFQVKLHNMPPSQIRKEMLKKGRLLPLINGLAEKEGMYIIVSAHDKSTPGTKLERVQEMRNCIGDLPIFVDFFNAGNVATWVKKHPSQMIWVQNKLGKLFVGWKPYGKWSQLTSDNQPYIIDEKARIVDTSSLNTEPLGLLAGIEILRSKLLQPGCCVRLIGMSGVGKTRLAQTLFEDLGDGKLLGKHSVVYADLADGVKPDAVAVATQLACSGESTILIIDNCSPEMHRSLAKICTGSAHVSLLTIEYDVSEFENEQTDVIILYPSGDHLIVSLLEKRFPDFQSEITERIAQFSGGNARIALAFANAIKKYGKIGRLDGNGLFERLFFQRKGPDRALLRSAEALALLYSHNGEETGEGSELYELAKLAEVSVHELHRHQQEIYAREIIQAKGPWRAILPQAIGEYLANKALGNLAADFLLNWLNNQNPRIVTSFSRRLGMLTDPDSALPIVNKLLESEQWFDTNLFRLDAVKITFLESICGINPEKMLSRIECCFEQYPHFSNLHSASAILRILQFHAYEIKYFERAARLLIRASLAEDTESNSHYATDTLTSLFYRRFSLCLAPIEHRVEIINRLFLSGVPNQKTLALHLLGAALEAWHFRPRFKPYYGSSSRTFGNEYESAAEQVIWYTTAMNLAAEFAADKSEFGIRASVILAKRLRGIWLKSGVIDSVVNVCHLMRSQQLWSSGWLSIKSIQRLDGKNLSIDQARIAAELEFLLRPSELLEVVSSHALGELSNAREVIDETFNGDYQAYFDNLKQLGEMLSHDEFALEKLLPKLLSQGNDWNDQLGYGYFDGSDSNESIWLLASGPLNQIAYSERKLGFLRGWLSACSHSDPQKAETVLDGLMNNTLYKGHFISLQCAVAWNAHSYRRVLYCIENDLVPISQYAELINFGNIFSVTDEQLASLIGKLGSRNCHQFVLRAAHLRIVSNRANFGPPAKEFLYSIFRYFNESNWFMSGKELHHYDYSTAETIELIVAGLNFNVSFEKLWRSVVTAMLSGDSYGWFRTSMAMVAMIDPEPALDNFLLDRIFFDWCDKNLFLFDLQKESTLLNCIEDEDIIGWCQTDPPTRYPLVLRAIELTCVRNEALQWREFVTSALTTKSLVPHSLMMMNEAVLPNSYSGSRIQMLENRKPLVDVFVDHQYEEVADWAKRGLLTLETEIERERNDIRQREQIIHYDSFE